jgi:hypothetical protein
MASRFHPSDESCAGIADLTATKSPLAVIAETGLSSVLSLPFVISHFADPLSRISLVHRRRRNPIWSESNDHLGTAPKPGGEDKTVDGQEAKGTLSLPRLNFALLLTARSPDIHL